MFKRWSLWKTRNYYPNVGLQKLAALANQLHLYLPR